MKCVGGPNDGKEFDASEFHFGDIVSIRLPVKPIEADEPIYHPFSDQARDRIVTALAHYMHAGDRLTYCNSSALKSV